jgi:hypothetical protein
MDFGPARRARHRWSAGAGRLSSSRGDHLHCSHRKSKWRRREPSFHTWQAQHNMVRRTLRAGIPRSGPTKTVWYYELPLPEGRKKYSKTFPIQLSDFRDCLKWWDNRKQGLRAWKVPADDLLAADCNLDLRNPRGIPDLIHVPHEQIATSVL